MRQVGRVGPHLTSEEERDEGEDLQANCSCDGAGRLV